MSPTEFKPRRALLLVVMLGAALVAWAVYPLAVHYMFPESPDSRGLFGDMYGGLNALFTAFAFAGLLYTIVLQRDEIALQLRELRETREEFEQQTSTFQRQQFESTFFSMLQAHTDLIGQMDNSAPDTRITGVNVLREIDMSIFGYINPDYDARDASVESAVAIYESRYPDYEQVLGPYFRSLYQLITYVDSTESEILTPAHRHLFAKIVRARMSATELRLLFYNALSRHGSKMKPLIERYALLKHLPDSLVFHSEHKRHFRGSAFSKPAEPPDKALHVDGTAGVDT